MSRVRSGFLLAAVAVMLASGPGLLAQQNTGSIYGRAVDEQGAGVPSATATLTGSLAPRTTVTDANGYFRLLKVPPARYKLTIMMPGFSTVEFANVVVTLG
ncbi:MAG TPA: carboxypeptidase-like regulatory domain-containing protein, partial [Thermoanaerobaculia bacterium]|nr:carboxypeptidase-like regulatory domain-containing protein [Thermoanaerobaculia bacterium]